MSLKPAPSLLYPRPAAADRRDFVFRSKVVMRRFIVIVMKVATMPRTGPGWAVHASIRLHHGLRGRGGVDRTSQRASGRARQRRPAAVPLGAAARHGLGVCIASPAASDQVDTSVQALSVAVLQPALLLFIAKLGLLVGGCGAEVNSLRLGTSTSVIDSALDFRIDGLATREPVRERGCDKEIHRQTER